MALSVPTEVDGMGVYVDVHEVVDYFTLDVVLHPIDQETTANIDDLDEGQVPAGQSEKRVSWLHIRNWSSSKNNTQDREGIFGPFGVV